MERNTSPSTDGMGEELRFDQNVAESDRRPCEQRFLSKVRDGSRSPTVCAEARFPQLLRSHHVLQATQSVCAVFTAAGRGQDQPPVCFNTVHGHSLSGSGRVQHRQIQLRDCISLISGFAIPLGRLNFVPWNSRPSFKEITYFVLRIGQTLNRCCKVPIESFVVVTNGAKPTLIHMAEVLLGGCNSSFCRCSGPFKARRIVSFNAEPLDVHITQTRLRGRIAVICARLKESDGCDIILSDAFPVQMHDSELSVGAAVALGSSFAIPPQSLRVVPGNAFAAPHHGLQNTYFPGCSPPCPLLVEQTFGTT